MTLDQSKVGRAWHKCFGDNGYTMFAGSYPDRIGNPDDPDDIDVITKSITIVDPRWHRVKDTVKKFVMQLPLRDAGGENVGLLVLAYHNETDSGKSEKDFSSRLAHCAIVCKNKFRVIKNCLIPKNENA